MPNRLKGCRLTTIHKKMKKFIVSYKDFNGSPQSKTVSIPVSDEEWYNRPGYYRNDAMRDNLFKHYILDAKEIISWVSV